MTYPDIDICRYYPTQLLDTVNRRLTASGYAVTVNWVTFEYRKLRMGVSGMVISVK